MLLLGGVLLALGLCAWVLVALALQVVARTAIHEATLVVAYLGTTVAFAALILLIALYRVLRVLERIEQQAPRSSAEP